jgi:hypothetical protein
MPLASSRTATLSGMEREPAITIEHVENRCPHLASLTVEASSSALMKIDLSVDLAFGEYTSGMTAGTVRFSLAKATLVLELSGCKFPTSDRLVRSPFTQKAEASRQFSQSETSKIEDQTETSGDAKFAAARSELAAKQHDKHSANLERSESRKDEFKFTEFMIKSAGGPETPTWIFDTLPGSQAIIGSNPDREWGVITANKTPASINASIQVAADDINIEGMSGLWPPMLLPRKRRIVRLLALRQINYKNYLSRVQLIYC